MASMVRLPSLLKPSVSSHSRSISFNSVPFRQYPHPDVQDHYDTSDAFFNGFR
ncbi:hypothetical protein BCR33DRAFT_128757 [Rhizoclosmatium globosum]|uniref:Uncharacterized protein n=1 Tax=Rhizoclosmatium globosum TaxID=329046 RepID=A0A1Y2CHE0_9FUNG|nr:hypothetical protein BCR33DRAFT_128757 [Rhizoclosmatium globosum]|eukprot:ORY46449.1 hypothetical protein BCR33DRAFT_128757 [Rhizoclosmatium globosum]